MKNNKKYILFFAFVWIVIAIPTKTEAQYFSSGQDPASVNWMQINTDHFQIIFPNYAEKKAQHIANILDTVYYIDSKTLQSHPKKISLIFRTNTVISNAFVGIAPLRTEFFNTPPQDIYPQEWFQQLGLHEYRHVVQISKVKQGFTKVLTWFTGQQGWAAVVGSYIPFWFLEGDAVYAETYHSYAGRGRKPVFTMPLRAQLTQKGLYSYDKAVFGSYKDFVPDHYVLGYHLVASGRKNYGNKLWNHTLNKVALKPWMIVPFSEGIKDMTNQTKTGYYSATLKDLKVNWLKQVRKVKAYKKESITKNPNQYISYRFPNVGDDGKIYAVKSSLDNISSFIAIDNNGREKIIHRPGIYQHDNLSHAKKKLCWAERKPDPRWGNRSYSVVFTKDLNTGKVVQLTKKSRYFAPELSHQGDKIAAVEVTQANEYFLLIMSAENGKIMQRIASPDNKFLQTPKWSKNNDRIIVNLLGNKGKQIAIYDLNKQSFSNITSESFTEISQPLIHDDTVYFIGTYNGLNNIYALSLNDKFLFQVSDAKYGISDVRISDKGEKLIYSDYTASGYQIVRKKINTKIWEKITNKKPLDLNPYPQINDTGRTILSEKIIPDKKHKVKKYNKLGHLFDFHSWAPVYFNINDEELKPGITFLSQNKLSSNFTTLSYQYDPNEETGQYKINMSYRGWYPVIDITADYGRRKRVAKDSMGNLVDYSFFETNLKAGIYIPLRYTRNQYFYGIQPGFTVSQTFLHKDKKAELTIKPQDFTSFKYRLYLYRYRKLSHRDIQTKWGQTIDISFKDLPFEKKYNDYIFSAEGIFYFPGLMQHDGIRIYTAYEKQKEPKYSFSSNISFPRGFSNLFYEQLYSVKADYSFPIVYPDMSLSSIAYIKRIKGSLFFDHAFGKNPANYKHFNSVGFDITADLHLLRFIAPFDLGLRTIYLPDENKFSFEFLFAIDYIELY